MDLAIRVSSTNVIRCGNAGDSVADNDDGFDISIKGE